MTLMANKKYTPATAPKINGAGCCRIAPPPSIHRINAITATLFIGGTSIRIIPLPPAGRLCSRLPQLLDNIVYGETHCSGSRHAVAHDLRQLPLALCVGAPDLLCADERTGPLVRLEQPTELQFAVGARDRVRIDGQFH